MSENGNIFKARDIGMRAQKKILSRMAGKNIARAFIDDVTASLLDNLYRLAKQYTHNKKEAEKLIKNIIKITIKIGVLHRHNLINDSAELDEIERLRSKLRSMAMAIISFYEVDFSYDRQYLTSALNDCHNSLKFIVSKHLTDKSMCRIESVFNFFANDQFLDNVFRKDSDLREPLSRVVVDLNRAIDNGDL